MKLEQCPVAEVPSMAENSLLEGHVVKDRWQVVTKIGQGAFGQVYKCKDFITKQEVALKLFCKCARQPSSALLKLEVQVLKDLKGKNFFPQFIGHGKTERFDYLVMELLGENLQQIRKKQSQKKFTLSTGVRLGQMMLESIHNMHVAGFIHRDIKPANFAIGLGINSRKLVIIDFSMAKKIFTDSGELIPPRRKVNYKGTPRYSSINVLQSNESGRGDDLISLFYSIYELLVDDLPWKKEKNPEELAILKTNYNPQDFLDSLPPEFCSFYKHIKDLRYEEVPDYQNLYKTFENIKNRRAIKNDDDFDFEVEIDDEKSHKRESVSTLHSKSSVLAMQCDPQVGITMRASLKTSEQNNTFCSIGSSLFQSEELSISSKSQAQQGLPLCWSCPTFSLFIRSNLKPPLKQFASINENVYEVDVRRNVAAKQMEDFSQINGRRNSLPYILDTENPVNGNSHIENKTELGSELGSTKIDGSETRSQKQETSANRENTNASNRPVEKVRDITQNGLPNVSLQYIPENKTNNNEVHSNSTTNFCQPQINQNIEHNTMVQNHIISSISEKIIELLVEEHSLFRGGYHPCENLNTTSCENEVNNMRVTKSDFSEVLATRCSVNSEQKVVNRRHRVNSENKYVKDESELKLHFNRRRQRLSFITDSSLQCSDEHILQTLNSVQSISMLNGRTFPDYFQDQSLPKTHEILQTPPGETNYQCLPARRVRYRRALTSVSYTS